VLASHNFDIVRKSGSRIIKIEDGLVKELPSL